MTTGAAGRAMDRAIAERVFGLWVSEESYGWITMTQAHVGQTSPLRPYSTEIAAAWQIVEYLRGRGWEGHLTVHPPGISAMNPERDSEGRASYLAHFVMRGAGWPKPGEWPLGVGETMPEAICKAALIAVGGGEEGERDDT